MTDIHNPDALMAELRSDRAKFRRHCAAHLALVDAHAELAAAVRAIHDAGDCECHRVQMEGDDGYTYWGVVAPCEVCSFAGVVEGDQ